MPPPLALLIFAAFISWLLYQDIRRRPPVSGAVWVVILWVAIICTRPVSVWLGWNAGRGGDAIDITEGSPLDRNVFLILIMAGIFILRKRRIDWRLLWSNNKWLFLFYIFLGLSGLWSDFPFVTLKRWVKELGNLVIVLLLVTEKNPMEAVRTVFVRCSSLLLPLSVLFIKYYPELGRDYDRFTGRPYYQGVTLGKNLLGGMVLMLTLFLVWETVQILKGKLGARKRSDIMSRLVLLAMAMWLFHMADSSTSLACAALGSAGIIALNTQFVRMRIRSILAYGAAAVVLLAILSTVLDFRGATVALLGRDTTFTGRTEIWQAALSERASSIVGAGFYSFWLGERAKRLSENYAFQINQAHNGYLETFLDGGAVGLLLLAAMLVSGGLSLKKYLLLNPDWGSFRAVSWLIALAHNWTEASFCRLSIVWVVLLLVLVKYPRSARSVRPKQSHPAVVREDLPASTRPAVTAPSR